MMTLIATPAYAYGSQWEINNNGYVTGYVGSEAVLIVPDEIFGITINGIGESAFEGNTSVKSVTLPKSCTYIDKSAFKNCANLVSIDAPGVTTVKKDAFFRCRKLDWLNMPELTKLSQRCFMSCGKLENLPVDNFTVIPQYAFSGCAFSEITFPNVTTVYNDAFSNCRNLVEITLPAIEDGCLYEGVFSGCIKLKRVNFSENLVSLGGYTFEGSTFTDFGFLENLEYVYWGDFERNNAVETIYLPNVRFLDNYAFNYMYKLKEVVLPSCTTVLGNAFYHNVSLKKIVFSDNLEYVAAGAFAENASLKYVVLNGLENIDEAIFEDSNIERVEFNKIQNISHLPTIENSIIALPSTFNSCTDDTTDRNYKVYGTRGTYAERWAMKNGHTFYEISQQNSIVSDVPVVFDLDSDEAIVFDAIGFNCKYEWYGSLDKIISNEDDVLIESANTNEFKPVIVNAYPYYYCKMTSSDYDKYGNLKNEVEIFSSVCEVYSSNEVEIDFENKLVYTTNATELGFSDVLYTEESVFYEIKPSRVSGGNDLYGTGALLNLYDDESIVESYVVIVKSDINGDGVVDALDASGIEREMNCRHEFTGNYLLAADSNRDQVVDIVDYQTAVNLAIS